VNGNGCLTRQGLRWVRNLCLVLFQETGTGDGRRILVPGDRNGRWAEDSCSRRQKREMGGGSVLGAAAFAAVLLALCEEFHILFPGHFGGFDHIVSVVF